MHDDLITTAQAAELLGKSVATVNRWAAADDGPLRPAVEFPATKGARLYRRSDVEALLSPAQPEDAA